MKRSALLLLVATGTSIAADAAPRSEPAAVLRDLTACRAVVDQQARLACYDEKVSALATAERTGDVVVADKAQIRQSKKALFGFGSLRLPIFGSDDGDAPTQIEAKIASVRSAGFQKWEFTLDNGMRWRQTDDTEIFPKAGQPVVIKSAALGSYFLRLPSRSVRVVRVQ
ncbi:hypothetical protein GCM10011380_18490 [Sphingomonas metalli]|uniref:Uncharacterized protein n=1 Tax=Sphingomonas metalli TaxID=1779358 RepID=A0A916WTJ4_9SPHN|nr:hypothetical protein [Sphingomonas metalli]GGB29282.1 hypothetical protein GCM10011380_18490 [Sphingomonas metalli]